MTSNNGDLVALICSEFNVGAPSDYLRTREGMMDIFVDGGLALRLKDRRLEVAEKALEKAIKKGRPQTIEQLNLIVQAWRSVTSYR